MNQAEFVSKTNKLEQFYGKELSNFQSEIWYKALRSLSESRYDRVINEIFKKFKTMPKLADVLEFQRTLSLNAPEVKEKVECDICNGTGYVMYKKHFKDGNREYDLDYAARCTCANGMSKNKSIPLITEVNLA